MSVIQYEPFCITAGEPKVGTTLFIEREPMPAEEAYALGTFQPKDDPAAKSFCGVVIGQQMIELSALCLGISTLDELLDDWVTNQSLLAKTLSEFRHSTKWGALAQPVAGLDIEAPMSPTQIFQSGANYKTHVIQLNVAAAAEAGDPDPQETLRAATALMQERADNGTPYVFLGLPSSICGPYDNVVLPTIGVKHDWELELAVVIGAEVYQVSRSDALSYVAGYVMVNDLTTRDRIFRKDMPSIGTDWLAGKNSPTFLPLGPWFVPAQFVADPMNLRIKLSLNGNIMQDETTADMIFDIGQLIEHVSALTPMRPGDLLLTGSPAGNGAHYGRYLQPGDVMESTITGLGTQRNLCVAP